MATISANDGLHTLVVVFTTSPDTQAQVVEILERVVANHAKLQGFVSNSILRSEDGLSVVEYIQWASRENLIAMTQIPGAMDHVKNPIMVSEMHSYIVSSVTES
jgi:nitric oxide reductase large subunit